MFQLVICSDSIVNGEVDQDRKRTGGRKIGEKHVRYRRWRRGRRETGIYLSEAETKTANNFASKNFFQIDHFNSKTLVTWLSKEQDPLDKLVILWLHSLKPVSKSGVSKNRRVTTLISVCFVTQNSAHKDV